MRKLTPKQEKFCQLYIELGNASEAYRQAYPGSAKWKDKNVRISASKLLSKPNISLTIEKLRADAAKRAEVTLDSHLQSLLEIRDAALADGKYNAACSAEVARGKVCGLYTDKLDVTSSAGPLVIVKDKS